MTLLRGKKAARAGAIKLRFANYLVADKLPVVPKTFGHVNTVAPNSWGMLGNDEAGNCVVAGAMHEEILWRATTRKAPPSYTTATALANYSSMLVNEGNAPFNPNDASTDQGLDVQLAASYRQNKGIIDSSGNILKIDAYAAIETVDHLTLAAYLFGAAGLGMNIPDSAEAQFEAGHVWDDLTSPGTGGHYTPVVGLNSIGNLIVVTWGKLQGVTPEYVAKRMDEAVAYLSLDYLLASGKTPEAFDLVALQSDLTAIRA